MFRGNCWRPWGGRHSGSGGGRSLISVVAGPNASVVCVVEEDGKIIDIDTNRAGCSARKASILEQSPTVRTCSLREALPPSRRESRRRTSGSGSTYQLWRSRQNGRDASVRAIMKDLRMGVSSQTTARPQLSDRRCCKIPDLNRSPNVYWSARGFPPSRNLRLRHLHVRAKFKLLVASIRIALRCEASRRNPIRSGQLERRDGSDYWRRSPSCFAGRRRGAGARQRAPGLTPRKT